MTTTCNTDTTFETAFDVYPEDGARHWYNDEGHCWCEPEKVLDEDMAYPVFVHREVH